MDRLRYDKIILLIKQIICYLVRLKYFYLGFSKNNYILIQNWLKIVMLPQFV